jgi:hypothetical protein
VVCSTAPELEQKWSKRKVPLPTNWSRASSPLWKEIADNFSVTSVPPRSRNWNADCLSIGMVDREIGWCGYDERGFLERTAGHSFNKSGTQCFCWPLGQNRRLQHRETSFGSTRKKAKLSLKRDQRMRRLSCLKLLLDDHGYRCRRGLPVRVRYLKSHGRGAKIDGIRATALRTDVLPIHDPFVG